MDVESSSCRVRHRKWTLLSKYLKLNSSTVIFLKVMALSEKDSMEWLTDWHYQEVIQLAYTSIKAAFEQDKNGVSTGHKHINTCMKGASVRVVFFVRSSRSHFVSSKSGGVEQSFQALPYTLHALVDRQSIHSKEGIVQYLQFKEPVVNYGSLFIVTEDEISKENIPEFEMDTKKRSVNKRKVNKTDTSKEPSKKKSKNLPKNQPKLDEFVTGCSKEDKPSNKVVLSSESSLDSLHQRSKEPSKKKSKNLPKNQPKLDQFVTGSSKGDKPSNEVVLSSESSSDSLHQHSKSSCTTVVDKREDEGNSRPSDSLVEARLLVNKFQEVTDVPGRTLVQWIQKYGNHFADIMNGKVESRRHTQFFSGSKARNMLHFDTGIHCLSDEQKDLLVAALRRLFCTHNPSRYNYVMSVLLPEAVASLKMDVMKPISEEV